MQIYFGSCPGSLRMALIMSFFILETSILGELYILRLIDDLVLKRSVCHLPLFQDLHPAVQLILLINEMVDGLFQVFIILGKHHVRDNGTDEQGCQNAKY
jgi:hypothetical protein